MADAPVWHKACPAGYPRHAMPDDAILTLNAGSSSLRLALFRAGAEPERAWSGQIAGIGEEPRPGDEHSLEPLAVPARDHAEALALLLARAAEEARELRIVAAGHRVVHGGERFAAPVVVDAGALAEIRRLVPLAPRHQPHAIAAIEALAAAKPGLVQVACFDTAFHRTQPELAQRFALPEALHAAGVRRYGFHGLSCESIAAQLPAHLGAAARGRVVVAHLGSGASATALREGRSVASSMGLTPLDGLVMATRPGALDPGVLLYLMREHGYDEARLSRLLYDESGLLGVSGLSRDMRVLLASDAPAARLAVALFIERLVREIGSLAAALGGLDALVFTGGIGENAAEVRALVCTRLAWLGVTLDSPANARHGPRLTTETSRVSAWRLATDEESVIAGDVLSQIHRSRLPSVNL